MVSKRLSDEFEVGWKGDGVPVQDLTEKQWQILESALLVFTEKGFSAASTSEIAARAGVAEGTIYRHFKTKKDILLAAMTPLVINLLGPHVANSLKKVVEANRERPLGVLLAAVLEERFHLVMKNRKLLLFALTEAQYHPELREVLVQGILRRVKGVAVQMIAERQAAGEIRADLDPWVILRTIIGSMMAYILTSQLLPETKGDLRHNIDQIVKLILGGIANRGQEKEGSQ